MTEKLEHDIAALLTALLTAGFNRSIGALEDAGAIKTKKMREEYKGIGSKYYDLVTEQMELTRPRIRQLVAEHEARQERRNQQC